MREARKERGEKAYERGEKGDTREERKAPAARGRWPEGGREGSAEGEGGQGRREGIDARGREST